MMTNYSENVLGILFRRKDEKGEWHGGAMYYLKDGLGAKKGCKGIGTVLAVLFSIFCFLASFGIGNMSQVNSMVTNVESAFGIPTVIMGIVLVIAVGAVIIGGLKRVAAITEKLVPFMVILYFIGAIVIIIMHAPMIPAILASIFKCAFSVQAAVGGGIGAGIAEAMKWGFKRGVFSNEAGLGSAPIAHAATSETDPVKQGLYGIFEVFMDTIVICTLTALVVLCSGAADGQWGVKEAASASTTIAGFSTVFGAKFGSTFLALALLLFATSTILGWALYGSRCMEYLFGTKVLLPYQLAFVVVIVIGATADLKLVWDISDTLNGLMAFPNLIGLLLLSPVVIKMTKEFFSKKEE
jgi:AGCS family alanine or glycine:cation symporter